MKKMFLSFVILLLAVTASIAQCDKKVVYYSDKQEMISPEGEVVNNKTDAVVIEFTKESITISINEKTGLMIVTIKETICEWKDLYKEGKAVYKGEFQKPSNGETSTGSMTVEAKEGKLHILVAMDRFEGRKIKVLVNKYEEKN
jgi:hypothetical protein